jgi:hypothetical protein
VSRASNSPPKVIQSSDKIGALIGLKRHEQPPPEQPTHCCFRACSSGPMANRP